MNMLGKGAAPVFNAGLGALAAAAAAFFLYAMPGDLFAALVEATGLPSLISAAKPPLGLTARLCAMVAAGAVMFLLVWAVLRRIDAFGTIGGEPVEEEAAAVLPRLRRADAHPDAPARRPLLAREDLGEPIDAPLPVETPEQPDLPEEWEPIEAIPEFLSLDAEFPDEAAEPAAQKASPEPVAEADAAADFLEQVRPVSGDPTEREPVDEAAPAEREALMARLPLPEDRGESVAVLFRRLDAGLANLEWPLRPGGQQAQEVPAEPQDPVSDQLRNALDDLRKMAGRAS